MIFFRLGPKFCLSPIALKFGRFPVLWTLDHLQNVKAIKDFHWVNLWGLGKADNFLKFSLFMLTDVARKSTHKITIFPLILGREILPGFTVHGIPDRSLKILKYLFNLYILENWTFESPRNYASLHIYLAETICFIQRLREHKTQKFMNITLKLHTKYIHKYLFEKL